MESVGSERARKLGSRRFSGRDEMAVRLEAVNIEEPGIAKSGIEGWNVEGPHIREGQGVGIRSRYMDRLEVDEGADLRIGDPTSVCRRVSRDGETLCHGDAAPEPVEDVFGVYIPYLDCRRER
jgi:hypothetical protein